MLEVHRKHFRAKHNHTHNYLPLTECDKKKLTIRRRIKLDRRRRYCITFAEPIGNAWEKINRYHMKTDGLGKNTMTLTRHRLRWRIDVWYAIFSNEKKILKIVLKDLNNYPKHIGCFIHTYWSSRSKHWYAPLNQNRFLSY